MEFYVTFPHVLDQIQMSKVFALLQYTKSEWQISFFSILGKILVVSKEKSYDLVNLIDPTIKNGLLTSDNLPSLFHDGAVGGHP